jgi:hypothetical protein
MGFAIRLQRNFNGRGVIGLGHFFAGRLDQAKAMPLQSLQEISTWPPTYRFLASCDAHMGHLDKSRDIIVRLRDMTPVVISNADHWRNPEHREFYVEGLRLAAGVGRDEVAGH